MRLRLIVVVAGVLSSLWTSEAFAGEQAQRHPLTTPPGLERFGRQVPSRPVSPVARRMRPPQPRSTGPVGNWLALIDLDEGSIVRIRTVNREVRTGRLLHASPDSLRLAETTGDVTIMRDAVATVDLLKAAPRLGKQPSLLHKILGLVLSGAASYGVLGVALRVWVPWLSGVGALVFTAEELAITGLTAALHSPPRTIYIARSVRR